MTSRFDRQAGFTLIELLVVLAVIALLLALVPSLTAGIGGMRFRTAARALTAELREMQATALGSGREITLAFDPRERSWRSSLDGRTHTLPAAIDRLDIRFPGHATAPVLRFMPDGSASLAVLHLSGGGRQAEITIDGLVGRVRLND